jgi:hypothetical protein
MKHPAAKGCTDDGTLAIVPIYIYPSWTDILAYYTDRITDVTSLPLRRVLRPRKPTLRDLARIVCLCTEIPIAPCSLGTPRGSHASKSSGDVAI